jgi:hypothetical protein
VHAWQRTGTKLSRSTFGNHADRALVLRLQKGERSARPGHFFLKLTKGQLIERGPAVRFGSTQSQKLVVGENLQSFAQSLFVRVHGPRPQSDLGAQNMHRTLRDGIGYWRHEFILLYGMANF